MTNKEFSGSKEFCDRCYHTIIGVNDDADRTPKRAMPTTRQASKFRNGKGTVYKAMQMNRRG